eukprot:CAMPEP_0181405134 /NCGR_PEP_ID=MMETSP1110-20121109/4606_1 /TAXON_ID=174948 /ORGANISM="Symbiodinium sp., Strain CCMP421" /LENGTH=91 /DNA_ID=CAMNT_0023527519 /DNA_START=525 /DNA_END=800 /DNA_ORIENTATION=-
MAPTTNENAPMRTDVLRRAAIATFCNAHTLRGMSHDSEVLCLLQNSVGSKKPGDEHQRQHHSERPVECSRLSVLDYRLTTKLSQGRLDPYL